MTDYHARLLRTDEHRAANDLFRAALHAPADSDEGWQRTQRAYQPDRTFGVFDAAGAELIGTTRSYEANMTAPGGADVPLAAVTGVAVRADRTRRGVLTELMRAQLNEFATAGVVAANLHATEGRIYGRFGYEVAALARSYTVDRQVAVLRDEVPAGGEIELLSVEAAMHQLPEIHRALQRHRPGMMSRPAEWWHGYESRLRRLDQPVVTAVHHGLNGADGFAVYHVERTDGRSAMNVELQYDNPDAFAGLWRYLIGVDLVDEIRASGRPVDEPTELLFTDPRACRTTGGADGIWLRLVDVPAALAVIENTGSEVVLEVVDRALPDNSGRYLLGAGPGRRTDAPAQLRLGVDALAMIYLGARSPSTLASLGRIEAADPSILAAADRLFHSAHAPWCGTFF